MKMMTCNVNGILLLKQYETCRLKAYDDMHPLHDLQPTDLVEGTCTIGYGHTGKDVVPGLIITQARADAYLEEDLFWFERGVNAFLKISIDSNAFSALVCFAFNLGLGTLQRSALLSFVNEDQDIRAAQEFLKYNKIKGAESDWQTKRRLAERALFLSPIDGASG